MANIRVTFDDSPSNARSESSIAINPVNPLQIVAASKKFVRHPIHYRSGDDKQWTAGDAFGASPFKGNVYAIWDNGGLAFARTTDHGATWTGTSGAAAGNIISSGTVYPEVTVADDGTPRPSRRMCIM